MSSARVERTPAGCRPLLRRVAVASALASGTVLAALLPGAVAVADEPGGTSVVGELVQAWPETAGHGAAEEPLSWVETAAGENVPVVTGDVDGVPAGSTVALTVGEQVDAGTAGAHEVLDAEILRTPPVQAPPPGPLTNQVTVAMVAPAGTPAGPRAGLQQVVDLVDGPVADFWADETGGAVAIGVTAAHDWIPTAAGCADPAALWDEAAAAVGFVPGPGRHLLLYLPPEVPRCAYALAEVGASLTSGGRLYVRDTSASVIAHELGHNFGLAHSSGRQCDGTVDGGDCRTVGYRDYYDVMGVSWARTGSLNVVQAAHLGVLPRAAVQRLTVTGGATEVTLSPVSGRSGIRALQLTDDAGVDYWLEYRPAAGRDAWLGTGDNRFALDAGLLLRRADRFPDTSVLLDASPSRRPGWDGDMQAALAVGSPVSVSGGQFRIVLERLTADGAVVRVVPSAPAAAGSPAPAPADPGTGAVLPADQQAPAAAAPADSAPTEAPAGAAATVPAPDLAPVPGVAAPSQPSLAAAADSSDGHSGGLLIAGAATALAGAVAVVVRTLRRPVRR